MKAIEYLPVICLSCGHHEEWPRTDEPEWVKAMSAKSCRKCNPVGNDSFNETQYRDQAWLDPHRARTNPNQLSLL